MISFRGSRKCTDKHHKVLLKVFLEVSIGSIIMLQIRNHISYSDGGISVAKWDKAQTYMGFLQMLKAGYEEKKTRLKVALNIENAWGGAAPSEYAVVNGWYGSF